MCGRGLRLPAFQRNYLQGPQTREPYIGPQGLRQTGEINMHLISLGEFKTLLKTETRLMEES